MRYWTAEELFEKEKYSAAQEEFKLFMQENGDLNDPFFIKARYYHALSALYLYNGNAESLLLAFLDEYPESIHHQSIYLELGRFYYGKKKYEQTVKWLSQVDVYDLDPELKGEYYFKLGYAQFREENLKAARDAFYEIKDVEGQYQGPALYYYSHIAYEEKSYQTALEGFLKLKDNPAFKKTVPYYIAQIYYLQGNYDKLLEYGPDMVDSVDVKNEVAMSHLIGDAFYRVEKYDEAVPFLEEYNRRSATTRDEDYQLGFAYFKSGSYQQAVKLFDRVAQKRDKLGQVALYHIGECYLKQENFLYARNAFEAASTLPFDADIEEDALYNYAVLSYKLDYNPFDEALEALELYLTRYPHSKRNPDIFQYLVNVYTTMRNYKRALQSLGEVENKDFKLKNAYQIMAYNYGVELFEDNQLDEAIRIFLLVKKYPIDPKLNALSKYWIAEAQYRDGLYKDAIAGYRSFAEEPGAYGLSQHNDAYYNIAYCYFKQEDYESASQNFRTFTQDQNEKNKEKLTDAYLRIGDCYFIQRPADDEQAVKFYKQAIATGGGQVDYAKFQIGLSLGYLQRYEEKAKQMLDIVNNHASSAFAVPALYEVGEAYRLMDNNHLDQAMKYYDQLVIDHPNHPKVIDAIFQIGMLHLRSHRYELAEKQFLRIIYDFDDPVKEKEAIDRLEDVYTSLNQPEKYLKLLEGQGVKFDQVYKDSLLYEAAIRLYEDSAYSDAVPAFEKYLNGFKQPLNETSAWYYLGTCHGQLGEEQEQVEAYEKVLEKPMSLYTEHCAIIASKYRYENKDYEKAEAHYRALENAATYPEHKLVSWIGLMRCLAFKEDFGAAKLYANKVLADPLALDNVKVEAHYVIAKAEFAAENYDVALPEFVTVAKESAGMIGAESQYHVALIFYLNDDYKGSEGEIRKMMKEKAGYDFWIAKALILQARNSIGLDDYVQAEYTINSVLNGYKVEDDGILEEANAVLEELKKLKEAEKDIDVEGDDTIEIDEGDL